MVELWVNTENEREMFMMHFVIHLNNKNILVNILSTSWVIMLSYAMCNFHEKYSFTRSET